MSKYIEGTIELCGDVGDIDEFEAKHWATLKKIIYWAEDFQENGSDIDINFEFIEDEDDDYRGYLCYYRVTSEVSFLRWCEPMLHKMKEMLKEEFPEMRTLRTSCGIEAY